MCFDIFNAILKKEPLQEEQTLKKPKKSEKLFLEKLSKVAHNLQQHQRGLKIGQLISLIRAQLGMPQRVLAKRAKVPQSTISKIESEALNPSMTTLEKILNAIECDLLITAVQRKSTEITRKNQALKKARRKALYLQGTMSLEKQDPSQELLDELIDEEVKNLLKSTSSKLWDEES